MNITVRTEDAANLGYLGAILLGYLRENPNFGCMAFIAEDTGMSIASMSHYISALERAGYVEKIYEVPFEGGGGRSLCAVKILK